MRDKMNRKILDLALPSIISNITVPLLGLCDVVIMGHVGGASHIGAIAVGSMIFNVMYWLCGFLRMGSSGLTAQAFGARNMQLAAMLLRRGLVVAGGIGALIILMQWPLQLLTFFLMQTEGQVETLCLPYYYICVWGAPAVLGLYALTGWLVGMQNTRIPMWIAIGQNVANIALSLVLVVACGMGIEGVAIGTVVAQWMGFLVALTLLRCYYGRMLRRHVMRWKEMMQGLGRFFRLNLDIFLRTVCLVSVNLYFTSAGAAQGAEILAANTLLMQFFMFFSYVMDGFAFAGEALAGRYYGAGDAVMLRQTIRRVFAWGLLVAVLFTLVYAAGGTTVLRLLTSDDGVVSMAGRFVGWTVLIPIAGMAAFVWDGVFIGTTATRGMLQSCLLAAVFFFGVYAGLSPLMRNHALWLAFILYLAVRGLAQTVIYNRKMR